jgi:AraC family transcriptional regulator
MKKPPASHVLFDREGPFRDHPQEHRTIGSAPLSLAKIDFPTHETSEPATDNLVICLALKGSANINFRFGERWGRELVRPGMFAPITPPHTMGEWQIDAPQQHLVVCLPEQALLLAATDDACAATSADLGWLHEKAFRDAFLYQLCLAVWDEARHNNPLGPMFGDCAHLALAAGLLRRADRRGTAERATRKLHDRELKRIQVYIDERLDQQISLRDVAGVVDLSPQCFARALKETSGLSPHQFLIARRLDMAKRLLLDPARSVAEIAATVGFSDQAHMTATFSRVLGYTPGHWRRERLS